MVLREVVSDDTAIVETQYAAGRAIAAHFHESGYISAVIRGCYTEVGSDGPQVYREGAIIVHRAGENHADYFHEAGLLLNFEGDDGSAGWWDRLNRAIRRTGILDDAVIWRRLQDTIDRPLPPTPKATPAWIASVLENFAWMGRAPIADAAASVELHPAHFSRAFREHVGFTPIEYRKRLRTKFASSRLIASSDSTVDVALAAGFHDQSHFSQVFRKCSGMSPARYRRIFAR